MICEICGQKEAVIHIQEIIDGRKKTVHMCQDCATAKGMDAMGLQGINIAEILYNLSTKSNLSGFNAGKLEIGDNKNIKPKPVKITVCPYCKWDSEKFQKTGRLGCGRCYEAFSDIIMKAISNIQKGNLHIGKRPGENTSETSLLMMDILNLQKKLDEHINKEEYEEAAKVRDQINYLKKKIETDNNYEE